MAGSFSLHSTRGSGATSASRSIAKDPFEGRAEQRGWHGGPLLGRLCRSRAQTRSPDLSARPSAGLSFRVDAAAAATAAWRQPRAAAAIASSPSRSVAPVLWGPLRARRAAYSRVARGVAPARSSASSRCAATGGSWRSGCSSDERTPFRWIALRRRGSQRVERVSSRLPSTGPASGERRSRCKPGKCQVLRTRGPTGLDPATLTSPGLGVKREPTRAGVGHASH